GLTCLSTAIPTAGALGQPTPEAVAKANQIVTRLKADGKLEAADKELKAIFQQGGSLHVEVHFVRMLHRDPDDSRPRPTTDAELLKKAVAVRLQAEEAAWRFGAGEKEYSYAEFV